MSERMASKCFRVMLKFFYVFFVVVGLFSYRKVINWTDAVTENHMKSSINGTVLRKELGQNKRYENTQDNLTIVSAYFDIGSFLKGRKGVIYRPTLYYEWSKTFSFITNPVVIFTDSKKFALMMNGLRSKSGLTSKTRIILVNRTSIWAFKLMEPLTRLFREKWYPRFSPNTVYPAYSCVQHAKFAVVADAVQRNYFKTPFYAWLDIGYFREINKKEKYFKLNIPPKMNRNKIAFNKIGTFYAAATYKAIFLSQMVWIGGGMFVGTPELLLRFEKQYQKAVFYFLSKRRLMNTDQQVLYAMHSRMGYYEIKPNVQLQVYHPTGHVNRWFYLGFLCRQEVDWRGNVNRFEKLNILHNKTTS